MNDQLKTLAKQVGIWFEDNKDVRNHTISTTTLERFAELIVKECVNTVQRRCVGDHNREDAEVMRCVADLKNYFGLEK